MFLIVDGSLSCTLAVSLCRRMEAWLGARAAADAAASVGPWAVENEALIVAQGKSGHGCASRFPPAACDPRAAPTLCFYPLPLLPLVFVCLYFFCFLACPFFSSPRHS